MQTLASAFRISVRSLFARPSYLIVSVTVLAVSIAAQLAIFAVVHALLLRPPSARAPEELAFVRSSLPQGHVSYPDFKDIQERANSFSAVFTYYVVNRVMLAAGDDLATVRCGVASGTYFPGLGMPATRGRLLAPEDDVENAAPAAVISAELSRQRQLEVGAVITLNTFSFTVVGILPEGFHGVERTAAVDVWIPSARLAATSSRTLLTNRGAQYHTVIGRLKPGVSLANANAELALIAQRLQQENPRLNYGMTLQAQSFAAFRYALDGSSRIMVLLCALVWFLFALAFTNFFALTLLRLLARRRELAVKVALGASRAHLGRGLLVELAVVVSGAMIAGCGLAWGLLRLMAIDPAARTLMTSAGVAIDVPALAAMGGSVVVCALVVWALALRHATRVDVLTAIKESASAPRRKASFGGLLALQFAIALFLAATAVSFVEALRDVAARAHPFRTDNLLLFDVNFRNLGVPDRERLAASEKYLARLRETPGVVAVGGGSNAPLGGAGWTNLVVRDRDPALDPDKGMTHWGVVTSGYFSAAGIRLLQGREIQADEVTKGLKVAVVNAAAVRRYWPEGDVLGQTFRPWEGGAPFTIVGVAVDVPVDTTGVVLPRVYMPWTQSSATALVFHVAVQNDSPAMRTAIADSLRGVWPHRTPPTIRSGRDQLGQAAADLATAMRVVLWLAGFALLVTGCGLYFFSAYTATQTLKETAIRQALGARPWQLFVAHVVRYRIGIVAGAVVGLALIFSARPLFERFGLTTAPIRLGTVLLAAALLLVISFVGLCVPLARMLRQDLSRTLNQGG